MSERRRERRFPGLLLWLIFFVLLLGAVLFFIISQTRIRQVVVSGSEHYTSDEITAMAGVDRDTTILDVLMGRVVMAEGLPYIKEIDIEYLSFNSIHIMVTEKQVISYIPYQNQFLALDKDGYIVGYEDEKIIDRPSVTGLYFDSASLGQKLEVSDEVLKVMLDVYHLGSKYNVPLEEVSFVYGDAEMIEGISGLVTIVFGDAQDMDRKMKDAAEVLSKLDLSLAGSLDLRADTDHYIFKESIGARYYLPYGERFLAIGQSGIIKKISVHRMLQQPLVTGLAPVEPEVGASLVLEGPGLEHIDLILNTADDLGIAVTEINFESGSFNKISLVCGDVRMLLGSWEDLEGKMASGVAVILTLPEAAAGYIDLREVQESYVFVGEASENE